MTFNHSILSPLCCVEVSVIVQPYSVAKDMTRLELRINGLLRAQLWGFLRISARGAAFRWRGLLHTHQVAPGQCLHLAKASGGG